MTTVGVKGLSITGKPIGIIWLIWCLLLFVPG